MTARISGFVSRADAGLRAPKSVSKSITPAKGGVSPHYGGGRQSAAEPGSDHARCVATWRGWQRFHMDSHGWSDIAYTGGFCNHGFAFAGRGAGVRTAANGTNAGNQNFYAVTWIGGEGQTPTKEALDAADWWIEQLRKSGAGNAVKPHRFFKPTGCPGDPLVGYAAERDGKALPQDNAPAPAPSPTPTPKPKPKNPTGDKLVFSPLKQGAKGQAVRTLQGLLLGAGRAIDVDGSFGPATDRHVRRYQEAANLKVDGVAGTNTFLALLGANIKN